MEPAEVPAGPEIDAKGSVLDGGGVVEASAEAEKEEKGAARTADAPAAEDAAAADSTAPNPAEMQTEDAAGDETHAVDGGADTPSKQQQQQQQQQQEEADEHKVPAIVDDSTAPQPAVDELQSTEAAPAAAEADAPAEAPAAAPAGSTERHSADNDSSSGGADAQHAQPAAAQPAPAPAPAAAAAPAPAAHKAAEGAPSNPDASHKSTKTPRQHKETAVERLTTPTAMRMLQHLQQTQGGKEEWHIASGVTFRSKQLSADELSAMVDRLCTPKHETDNLPPKPHAVKLAFEGGKEVLVPVKDTNKEDNIAAMASLYERCQATRAKTMQALQDKWLQPLVTKPKPRAKPQAAAQVAAAAK